MDAVLYSIPVEEGSGGPIAFEPNRGGMLAWYPAPGGRGHYPGIPWYALPASSTKYNPEYYALLEVAQLLFG
jgi:hypothetical protein